MTIRQELENQFGVHDILIACQKLVEEYFPGYAQSNRRRDVFEMARTAQIELRTEETESFDGRIQVDHNGATVVTLSSLSKAKRTRFTLAHEIGHWLLNCHGLGSKSDAFRGASNHGRTDEEQIANFLAAEILMPISGVASIMFYSTISFALVREISKRFDVSFLAALRRVADVSSNMMLYVNVVPHRFRDLASHAEVDDAIWVFPQQGQDRDRVGTRLMRKYEFQRIRKSKRIQLGIRGQKGRVFTEFEVRFSTKPRPNCDLLAIVPGRNFRSYLGDQQPGVSHS